MISTLAGISAMELVRRASTGDDGEPGGPDSSTQEQYASLALFILIMLLILAFFISYLLQEKKVQAVHETVISIFAGMTVGLILRVSGAGSIRSYTKFDYQIFFNLLLPPIILGAGYELHQANFFRNIGAILTFAFAGTFLSAVVIALILFLFTRISTFRLTFVDAMSVGATLSATDPVTILAIFNTFKVDPKLYTIIFGESILNDAIAIVVFETAQEVKKSKTSGFVSLFTGIGFFLKVFCVSLILGVVIGVLTALVLKYTYVRRYPKIESCLIVLIAYSSYFLAQGIEMSGIVSLLFCGITLKHYAYFNMSRRTQLSTKYFFQVLAQLSENFIFIYLGLSLFTDPELEYRPDLIIVTVIAVCAARWVAVFPLSAAINWFIRYRARRRGVPTDSGIEDELPYSYQAMLFWAGLRGAVGVALAALLHDDNSYALKATVLVVVVLTVIIFGGTTSRMLEILGIRTGVVEEIDSDDEFDIETVGSHYYKRSGTGIGYMPPSSRRNGNASSTIALDHVDKRNRRAADQGNLNRVGSYVSGSNSGSGGRSPNGRKNSTHGRGGDDFERADLLGGGAAGRSGSLTESDIGSDVDTSDLPPPAPRGHSPSFRRGTSPNIVSGEGAGVRSSRQTATGSSLLPEHHTSAGGSGTHTPQSVAATATAAIRSLLTAEDHAALFRQLDEDFIKPKLLLDAGHGRGGNGGGHGGSGPL